MIRMIKILYFASIKEKLGLECESIPFENGMTLAHVLDALSEKHPVIKEMTVSKNFLYAINQEISRPEASLKDGDEIAILPPLSGGI